MIKNDTLYVSAGEVEPLISQLWNQDLNGNLDDGVPTKVVIPEGEFVIEDEDAKRLLKKVCTSPQTPVFSVRFLSSKPLKNFKDPLMRQAIENGFDAGFAFDMKRIMDVISSDKNVELGAPDVLLLSVIMADVHQLGIIEEVRYVVERMANQQLHYKSLDVNRGEVSRKMNKNDFYALIRTMVAISDFEQRMSRYDEGRIRYLVSTLPRLFRLKDDIMRGRITVVSDSSAIPDGSAAAYGARSNTLICSGDLQLDVRDASLSTGGLTDAQVIIHELVHALQDKERRFGELADNEGEAHAIEMFYHLVRYGEERTREEYGKSLKDCTEKRGSCGMQVIENIYRKDAAYAIRPLFKKSMYRQEAVEWGVKLLHHLSEGCRDVDVFQYMLTEGAFFRPHRVDRISQSYRIRRIMDHLIGILRSSGVRTLRKEIGVGDRGEYLVRMIGVRGGAVTKVFTLPDQMEEYLHALRNFVPFDLREFQKRYIEQQEPRALCGLTNLTQKAILGKIAYSLYAQHYDCLFDFAEFFEEDIQPLMEIVISSRRVPHEVCGF